MATADVDGLGRALASAPVNGLISPITAGLSSHGRWLTANRLGALVTILGGLHYGFSIAVVGTFSAELRSLHGDSLFNVSLTSSCALLGAFLGSPSSGLICERFGRRAGTVVGEVSIIAGSVACALAPSWVWLFAGRTVVGIGIGFCTLAKPLYVKETADPGAVSQLLAAFAPSVALGVLAARLVVYVPGVRWSVAALLGAAPACILLLVACVAMPVRRWLSIRRPQGCPLIVTVWLLLAGPSTERLMDRDSPPQESPHWQRRRLNPPTADSTSGAQRSASAGGLHRAVVLACGLGLANQGTGSYAFVSTP
jgi:MFS family permease